MNPSTALLRDQVALVTGATSGIGRGVAQGTGRGRRGGRVNYRGERATRPSGVVREIERRRRRRRWRSRPTSSDEAAVAPMFDEHDGRCGRIDILVANAGVQQDAPVAEMTLEQWQTVIDVNLTGQFLCVREAVRRFVAQQPAPTTSKAAGKIICMSSVHELIPWAGHVNYAASKGGIMQLMKSARAGSGRAAHPRQRHRAGCDQDRRSTRTAGRRPRRSQKLLRADSLRPHRRARRHRQGRRLARLRRVRLRHRHDAVRRRRHEPVSRRSVTTADARHAATGRSRTMR